MANTGKVSNSISWYRIPLKGESLRGLSKRSDLLGLLQACGHLGLLVLTGAAAFYANGRFPLPVLLLIIFLHGTFYSFILNGFHELCHSSVFKTKALNNFFLHLFSFLGWYNPVMFWTSHSEHHKYTLHQPDDLEVVMPIKFTLQAFIKSTIVNPLPFFNSLMTNIRFSFGKISKKDMPGEWEVDDLFPPSEVENRRRLFNWARTLLVGHGLIIGISIYTGLWLLPVLITFGNFYGGWLRFFCNNCQHVGLEDKVPDFRLCCWTVILNPFVRFLYWHMNYHIEHHMYAAVPCYNLGRLHKAIEYDLPESPNGLYAVWKKIVETLKKQKVDPEYHYVPELPTKT
jgi:fatty acid desaturase